MYRKLTDFVAGTNYTYLGEASPGTATSQALWRVKRIGIDETTDGATDAGIASFDKVWDYRSSETYL